MSETIYTSGLSRIASAVVGRKVEVKFDDGETNGRTDGATIWLSRGIFRDRRGDPCQTFLHELGHCLFHAGRQPSQRCEDEAIRFAEAARAKVHGVWFGHCVRNALTQAEYRDVIASLLQVACEFDERQANTPSAVDDPLPARAMPRDEDMDDRQRRLAAKLEKHRGILGRNGAVMGFQGKKILERSIQALEQLLHGDQSDTAMRREIATLPTNIVYKN